MKNTPLSLPEIPRAENMTTQDYAYQRLHNAIMVGAIEPGTALTIRGLADYLALSPTPIREAIRRLSSERAIDVLGNRRVTVPEMAEGRFDELIRLRIAVERHAGERALPYVSDVLIDTLRQIDDEMDVSVRGGDFDLLTNLNQTFHRMLYTANPNQAVMPLIESVWLQLGPFQRQVLEQVRNYYLVDRHKEILTALQQRDATALATAIEADIRDGIGQFGRDALDAARS